MSGRYRVFFDESGDRSNRIDDSAASRYFALCGCAFLMESYRTDFRPAVDRLRRLHFPEHDTEEPVILHREEIKEARGSFAALQDEGRRRAFDADLLSLIGDASCQVKELKLKIKAHDITGIQLADLLAYPLKQWMLFDRGVVSSLGTFSQEICGRVESKWLERVTLFLQA